VKIDAILDEQGNVINMKVVSGHLLLYQAAVDARKKWKYEPTYLHDRPIAVELIVTITFQFSQVEIGKTREAIISLEAIGCKRPLRRCAVVRSGREQDRVS
jgi:hypothetical protein